MTLLTRTWNQGVLISESHSAWNGEPLGLEGAAYHYTGYALFTGVERQIVE